MKFFTLFALSLLAATKLFASGSPVVECTIDGTDKSVHLNMGRTDEDLGDVMGDNEGDEYDVITSDPEPKNPDDHYASFEYSRVIDAKKGKYETIAEVYLPERTLGSYSRIALGDGKKDKREVSALALASSTYSSDNRKEEMEISLVATNKENLLKSTMQGLLTLKLPKSKLVKEDVNLKRVAVTCTPGWE